MPGSGIHDPESRAEPRPSGRSPLVAGWINIALGLLVGFGTTVGFVTGGLVGAETPFFILVACLLVAVGAFVVAVRPVPVVILAFSLLFLGIFLGFGLLIGGSVLGAADGGVAKVVGAGSLLLAVLEAWSILAVWRNRKRRTP